MQKCEIIARDYLLSLSFVFFRRSRSDSISRYSIFSDSFYKVVNIQSCVGAGRWRRRSSALSTINLLRRWGDQNIFCQCKNRHKRGCYVYTQPLTPLWYSNFVRGTGGVEMLDPTNTDLFLTIYIWHFLEWYTNSFLTLNAWNCLFCIYILYPLKTCLKDLFSTMFVELKLKVNENVQYRKHMRTDAFRIKMSDLI